MSEQVEQKKPADKRTAGQKIADLENAVMSLFHVNDTMARDIMNLKEALKLLNNKVTAITQASNDGEPLTDEVLTRLMLENNVSELARKVDNMVSQGFIEKEEQVSENSFIVARELDDEGKVVNPRLQFALKQIDAQFQSKFLGTKAGDVLKLKEDGNVRVQVLESYKIQPPPAPATPELTAPSLVPAEEVTTSPAEETPTTTETTTATLEATTTPAAANS